MHLCSLVPSPPHRFTSSSLVTSSMLHVLHYPTVRTDASSSPEVLQRTTPLVVHLRCTTCTFFHLLCSSRMGPPQVHRVHCANTTRSACKAACGEMGPCGAEHDEPFRFAFLFFNTVLSPNLHFGSTPFHFLGLILRTALHMHNAHDAPAVVPSGTNKEDGRRCMLYIEDVPPFHFFFIQRSSTLRSLNIASTHHRCMHRKYKTVALFFNVHQRADKVGVHKEALKVSETVEVLHHMLHLRC